MSKKIVFLTDNPLDVNSYSRHEVDDVCAFLATKYKTWPMTGRIYHEHVAKNNDVTPSDEGSIKRLQELQGTFFCIVYPSGPLGIAIGVALLVSVIAVAAVYFLMPRAQAAPPPPPIARASAAPNRAVRSSNNELSERKNQARVNGRIPDIYGTVRSTPDLISVPFTVYDSHRQIELAYMCIGRGEYEIHDVKDDTTLIEDISGASVEIYGPDHSPHSGDPPDTLIGNAITQELLNVKRITSVNGQTILPPNDVSTTEEVTFVSPNEVRYTSPSSDISDKFNPGDTVEITASAVNTNLDPSGTASRDFSGTYTVFSVTTDTIVLDSPEDVNSAWDGFIDTDPTTPTIHLGGPRWVGPFIVEQENTWQLLVNVVAPNGLYQDDGTQAAISIEFAIEVTPINSSGVPISGSEEFTAFVVGSAKVTSQRAKTLQILPAIANNRYSVRARRITEHDDVFAGTISDEIKWADLYAASSDIPANYGNVTTIYSATYATAGALAVKDRKLNCLVTRKIPQRISGSTFSGTLYSTNDAAEIISAIALDPFIGNRSVDELDFDNIYDTVADIETYFGTASAKEFSHTLDDDNISFEETIAAVATAIFCTAYRRGSQIKLFFEKATEDSVLLFNHRNKVPGTETRTVRFGNQNDNDGVQLEYTSPVDDSILTYEVPTPDAAVNPKKIETIGVRSRVVAHLMAWREWAKIQNQNIAIEFDGMQEANLLIPGERILIADNTRANTQDGEVIGQVGLEIELSQDVVLEDLVDYTIYLQLYDGTVDAIAVTAGSAANKLILDGAPTLALVMDDDSYARTTYILSGSTDRGQLPFIVEEKEPKPGLVVTVRASSYDSRIYDHDEDFIDELIDEEEPDTGYDGDFVINITGTPGAVNVHDWCLDHGYIDGLDVVVNVVEDATVEAPDDSTPSLVFGDFDPGVTVTFNVYGAINGATGAAGTGGALGTYFGEGGVGHDGGDGGDGGLAVDAVDVVGYTVEFTIQPDGFVRAGKGGGGGGGGGGATNYAFINFDGGPGGAGDGSPGTLGNGAVDSTQNYGGAGGDGGNYGDYGDPGEDGEDGEEGHHDLVGPPADSWEAGGSGGTGGAGGEAIHNISNLSFTNNGTLIGVTS